MDSRTGAAANYQMSYFQPPSELVQEDDGDTIILDLIGFKKEQLKAQLARESRTLKISGARQLENNRWLGFHKDFPVSPNCDTQKISARFDDGVLFVKMPKLISPVKKEDSTLPPSETRQPKKPTEEPSNTPEKNVEQAKQKTLASDDQNQQNGTKNIPEKSTLKEETKTPYAKTQEWGKARTSETDDKKTQIGAKNVPEKLQDKEEAGSSNAKSQDQAQEKTLPKADQSKQTSAENVPKKSLEKEETESSKSKSSESAYTENVDEKSAGEKRDSNSDDQKAETSLSNGVEQFSSDTPREKVHSWGKAIANAYTDDAINPAARLKMARQKMNTVLYILLAFLLGLYFSSLVRNSKKAEN